MRSPTVPGSSAAIPAITNAPLLELPASDGSLWVSTSNRDQVGREDGMPQKPEGDIILRLTP